MGFLRRLFGGADTAPRVGITVSISREEARYDPGDGQCFVTVGGVTIPGAIYRDHQRDVQDWSSGVRLEDPRTGRMLLGENRYPRDFLAAGARSVAVVGLPHHPDAQRDQFAVGARVGLVPEPDNPVNPRAIAVRSADGRYLAGYVPDDELDRIWSTEPTPREGIIVWEQFSWRPRIRKGLIALVGPTVELRMVPSSRLAAEAARREAAYARGRIEEEAENERERALAAERRQEREAERARRAAEREAARKLKAQAAAWRAEGRCIECGAPIEPQSGRGRPPIRCVLHRGSANT